MERGESEHPEGRPKVLVVDDEPAVRKILEQLLVRDGFVVWPTSGLNAALNALQAATFDAVVLDHHLLDASDRDRSGIDLLSFLRVHDHLRHIPVIILTGGSLTDAEEQAAWALHADVVNKSEGWHTVQHYLRYLTSKSTAQLKAN